MVGAARRPGAMRMGIGSDLLHRSDFSPANVRPAATEFREHTPIIKVNSPASDLIVQRNVPESKSSWPSQERYSRQILFAPIGPQGQESICASKVAVVGCGAIGASTCALLARAGVGSLRIIDRDYVEPSNLQRQL